MEAKIKALREQMEEALGRVQSKAELDALLNPYDHACLNDLPDFRELNPTSENIAKTLYKKLAAKMNDGNVRVRAIRVSESDSSRATYFEGDGDGSGATGF